MGYLQGARQRLASAAHAVGRHAVTAGKIALATAAVAGAAYHAHQTHAAREAASHQRYRDNLGNFDWYVNQPDVREALERRNAEPAHNPHANHGHTPSYIVPVKYK